MSRHVSVLGRDGDRKLVPILNWRAKHTWWVFLGIWFAFGVIASIVIILCGLAAERLVQHEVMRVLTELLPALVLCWIACYFLKRTFPLRDTTGRAVPGNPKPDFSGLSYVIPLGMAWMIGHLALWFGIAILARDVVGVIPETIPIGSGGIILMVIGPLSLEIPFRMLLRAPRADLAESA